MKRLLCWMLGCVPDRNYDIARVVVCVRCGTVAFPYRRSSGKDDSMNYECDCGMSYPTAQEVISCADRRHGLPERSPRNRLRELLKKAQSRLCNQGDVPEITLRLNLMLYDEIERELGGSEFLLPKYFPSDQRR